MMQNPIAEAKAFAAEKPFKEALIKAHAMPADSTPDLTKATRLEVSADVVSMLAMKGVEWAVKISRDTIDGVPVQETKLDAQSAMLAGAAAGATAALLGRVEEKLLSLRRVEAVTVESKAKLIE